MHSSTRNVISVLLTRLGYLLLAILVIVGWLRIFSGNAHPILAKWLGTDTPIAFLLTIVGTLGMTLMLIPRSRTALFSWLSRNAD